jgi:hypothetical protein
MDETELDNLIADLKEDEFKEIGEYTRIYPDAPDCTVNGIFAININHTVYIHDGGFASLSFDVYAIDQDMIEGELHDTCHGDDHGKFWIHETESEERFWEKVRAYLNKFQSLESFLKYVENVYGFEKVKHLWKNAYHMIKDDLPDGDDFESFCESM